MKASARSAAPGKTADPGITAREVVAFGYKEFIQGAMLGLLLGFFIALIVLR